MKINLKESQLVENGLPRPTYEYEWTAVRTTFYKAQVELNETEKRILIALKDRNLSSKEIAQNLGQKSLSGAIKKSIKNLLEIGFISYTISDTPRSSRQKYRLVNRKMEVGK